MTSGLPRGDLTLSVARGAAGTPISDAVATAREPTRSVCGIQRRTSTIRREDRVDGCPLVQDKSMKSAGGRTANAFFRRQRRLVVALKHQISVEVLRRDVSLTASPCPFTVPCEMRGSGGSRRARRTSERGT